MALAASALVATGCPGSSQPPPPAPGVTQSTPPATPAPSATTSASASAVGAPCPDATRAFAAQQTVATFCAASTACAGFSGLPAGTDGRREPHEWLAGVSPGWAVLTDGRVYELGPNGFSLRYLVDWGKAELLGDRLWVEQDGEATLVELTTGALTRLGRVRFVAQSPNDLYVADDVRTRRLRRSDLAELGSVAWVPKPFEYLPADVVLLRGGTAMLVDARPGGVLADFATGTILRQHLRGASVRPDGARLVACDLDASALVEVDTATGNTTATFEVQGLACSVDLLTTPAAYSGDPRYVFWGEQGPPGPPRGLPSVVVAVGDTLQGTVARYEDRAVQWSASVLASPSFDAAHGRLCLGFAVSSASWEVCDWQLAPGGRAVRSRGPIPAPVGFPNGAELVAEATSPSGNRTAALFVQGSAGTLHDLAVAVATRGKLDRTILVAPGKLPWFRLEPRFRHGSRVGVRAVELVFFDERHAGIVPASDGLPPAAYLDVDTGSVQPLCKDVPLAGLDDCSLAGDGVAPLDLSVAPANPRWISIWETESLFDGTTGKTYSVKASDAEWEKATRIVPACP